MPADLEQTMALFADVSRFDAAELVLTARYAERRAAPWIRRYCPRDFAMEPRPGIGTCACMEIQAKPTSTRMLLRSEFVGARPSPVSQPVGILILSPRSAAGRDKMAERERVPADFAGNDALFRTLIGTAVDGIMVIDEHGVVLVYNPACERLFGFVASEVIGHNIKMLMPESYGSAHDNYIDRYMATAEKRIIGIGRDVQGRRKDGSTFPMYLSVGEGVVGGQRIFVGIVHDISERQAYDRHIRELQHELLHVTRLTAMGQMTSALAHELNQPLTAISNYANAARRTLEAVDGPQAALAREILAKADGQILRAGEIIRRLREFIEKRETRQSEENINRVMSDAIALALIGSADSNVKVGLDMAADIPPVLIDRIQIEQVAVNLLRNAAEAMEHSKVRSLTISTSRRDRNFVQVVVSDTGPGLPAEVASHLFQPFVTTKDKGMGMGLSICRTIVEAHGGRIWAEPGRDRGTAFYFTLPVARENSVGGT
jgi:two-component system sensor kinase FixL